MQTTTCPPQMGTHFTKYGQKEGWVNLDPATWTCQDRTQVVSRVLTAVLQFNHWAMGLTWSFFVEGQGVYTECYIVLMKFAYELDIGGRVTFFTFALHTSPSPTTLLDICEDSQSSKCGYLEAESWKLDFLLVRLKCFATHPSSFFSLRRVGRKSLIHLGFTPPWSD